MTLRVYPLNDPAKRWFVSSVVSTREGPRQILNRVTVSPAVSPAEADGLAVAAALREDPSAAVSVVGSLEIDPTPLVTTAANPNPPHPHPPNPPNPHPHAAYLIAFFDETLDPPALRGVDLGSEYPLGVASSRLHQALVWEERGPTFADALRTLSRRVAPPITARDDARDLAWVRPYLTDRAARALGLDPPKPSEPVKPRVGAPPERQPPRDVNELKERLGLKAPTVSDEDRRLIEAIEDTIERADYQSIGTAIGRYNLALEILAVVRAHAPKPQPAEEPCGDVSSDGHSCEWSKGHKNPMHYRVVDGVARQWESGGRAVKRKA